MSSALPNSFRSGPDERGHFGTFGGRFVAETLMPLILDLEKAYTEAKADPAFQHEMNGYLKDYVGRPSPLYFAQRLTEHLGGAKVYLKREELNHTGSHKVNNVLGQIMEFLGDTLSAIAGEKAAIIKRGVPVICAEQSLEAMAVIEAQAKASNPEASSFVAANAGSGKTHVLVNRVIRLLLNDVPPEKILCITFTKAAAANMLLWF